MVKGYYSNISGTILTTLKTTINQMHQHVIVQVI